MLNLKYIEKYRENNRIEAKRALGGFPHSVWESYSAFANTLGGIILLGVEEMKDKSFKCIDLPSPEGLAEEFLKTVNDKRQVSANVLKKDGIRIIEQNKHRIVVIDVPKADRHDKPVFVYGDFVHGAYRRGGEGDYRCSHEQIQAMLRDKSDNSADRRIIDGMTLDDIDTATVHKYRAMLCKTDSSALWQSLDDTGLLYKTGAIAYDSHGVLRPTCAGLLMFGKSASISAAFSGYRLSLEIAGHGRTDFKNNLFNSFFSLYKRLCGGKNESGGLNAAIYEGLVNSIVHADYHDNDSISVISAKNRLVISNPGCMRVSYDTIGAPTGSDIRNPVISNMFGLINITHGTGHGFEIMRSLENLKLYETFNPDRTVLSLDMENALHNRASAGLRQDIIDYLTKNISASVYEIAIIFNLPVITARQYLDNLAESDIIILDKSTGKYALKA